MSKIVAKTRNFFNSLLVLKVNIITQQNLNKSTSKRFYKKVILINQKQLTTDH